MSGQILIKDARVIDGTGAPWFRADVLIGNGRIVRVFPGIDAAGAEVVDGRGLYLAPGFIDAHCHDDLMALREPQRLEKALQGVTTVVVGNCSFSLYPAPREARNNLRRHFGALLGKVGEAEVFEDLDAYRRAVEASGTALNVVSLVGHAALRLAVIGGERRAATAGERSAMQALLAEQLQQGAAGLSLGLVYPPSAYADADELAALASTVRDHGKLLTAHIRSYEGGLVASVDEFLAILRQSGAAGLLSHLQSAGRPNWGRIPEVIGQLETARCEGIDVSFDMYPYPAGSTYLLQLLPPAALDDGIDRLRTRLGDPDFRASLRRWMEDGSGDPHAESKVALIGWDNVRLSAIGAPELKQLEGLSIAAAAPLVGLTPFEFVVRLIETDAGQTGVVLFQLDEADLHAACTHRLHLVCSDGLPRPGTRPHPRGFGTFPRVAGRLRRQGWFTLEEAVRRMTSATAQRFSLADRGVIREGLAADLVLFDETIDDPASFDEPTRLATGVVAAWVAGEAIVADGRPTGRRPGRLIPTGTY